MKFFFQLLLLLVFLSPWNPALAQVKNECIAPEADHLAFMETKPGSRSLCVDARFLSGCQGQDNGKVTLMYVHKETDSIRGEYVSALNIYSKTDSRIKLASGRWGTGKYKNGIYTLFSGGEGYHQRYYVETANAVINGKKVEAVRSGPMRENVWLVEVSQKITRVLQDLRDPCEER